MKTIGIITLIVLSMASLKPNFLYDFTSDSKNDWQIVDDRVMGGVSQGGFTISEEGHCIFSGHVSLENNGGFSSLMHPSKSTNVEEYKKVILRVKGDKKKYQFRLKANRSDYYSYIQTFETNGEWQEVEIAFKDFSPSFRGRALDMPNFPGKQIEEMRFLIANYKEEDFKIEIDWIALK
jgi:hypothetical protein